MKSALVLFALPAAATVLVTLQTDYTRQRTLRTEVTIAFQMETTSMERDGEPIESSFGTSASEESRHLVQLDQILANADGAPTHVKRTFDTIEGEIERARRDSTDTTALEGPLAGVTLELKRTDEGDVQVEIAEGSPDGEDLLEGHRLELALDALLPDGDVEEGASWDLDEEQIERALGLDLVNALYRVVEEEPADGGGGGRGRRGFGRTGSVGFHALQHVEWSGEATLVTLEEDHEGEKCARIELELEGEGEMPMPEMGGGRDRAFGIEGAASTRDQNTITAKLTGNLWFATESGRPRTLDLSGEIATESEFTFSRNDEESTMAIAREGKCAIEVQITEE